MYRLKLVRPGRPSEDRTAETTHDIADALTDLLTGQDRTLTDDDRTELGYAAGDARLLADVEGFAALQFNDGVALTVRPVPAAADVFTPSARQHS